MANRFQKNKIKVRSGGIDAAPLAGTRGRELYALRTDRTIRIDDKS